MECRGAMESPEGIYNEGTTLYIEVTFDSLQREGFPVSPQLSRGSLRGLRI